MINSLLHLCMLLALMLTSQVKARPSLTPAYAICISDGVQLR